MAKPAIDPFIGSAPQGLLPTRVRYWVLVFTVTLAVVTYIDRVAISFALPYIGKDLNLDSIQKGWVLTAFALAYSIFEIPGGFLGDWMGPRRVILRIVLWWSFFTAATGWAWNYASLLTTRFLFGAGEAGCFPNLTKMFTIWLPERERVRAQGLMWMSARWGGAFTPPLAAAVITWVGWRHAFEIFGGLGVIWAAAFALWYRDNPLDNPKLNAAERELVRPAATLILGPVRPPWKLCQFRTRVAAVLAVFLLSYGWYFNITWLPTYCASPRNGRRPRPVGVLPLFMVTGKPVSVFIGERLLRWTGSVDRTRRIVASFDIPEPASPLLATTYIQDARGLQFHLAGSFFNDLAMPRPGPPPWIWAVDTPEPCGAMNSWGNLGGAVHPPSSATSWPRPITTEMWRSYFGGSRRRFRAGFSWIP